ncbi:MAG: hypothetical protein ACYCVY_12185 [Acidiferrobacteraceae bacterium]
MHLDPDTIAKVVSPILTLILGPLVSRYTQDRVRLISFIGHISAFKLRNNTDVYTHSVIVRNTGRKVAHNVRLTHRVLPPDVTIYPPIQYSVETSPAGYSDIVIPVLVPSEQITISYLYFPPITWEQINVNTKSDEGFAKIIQAIPTPQASKKMILAFVMLMFVGASVLMYWLIRLVLYAL